MTDEQLADGFEAGTLAPGQFRHREHVRLAWIYLARLGRAGAERRLCEGLQAFATRAGRPDKFDAGLTAAWVAVLADAADSLGPTTFDALVRARPDLLEAGSIAAKR
jgi:hypothetical protein